MSNNYETTDENIKQAIEDARSACKTTGNFSSECAAAWDVVEEMQAAKGDRQEIEHSKTSLDRYCEQRPDADECRIYDL